MKKPTSPKRMRIALRLAFAGAAAVLAASCGDMYGNTKTYDVFVETFGANDPTQFDLTRNVCAYIAMESLGIANNTNADIFDAIRNATGYAEFETAACTPQSIGFSACAEKFMNSFKNTPENKRFANAGIAPECLKPASAITEETDKNADGETGETEQNADGEAFRTCIRAQMALTQTVCDSLQLTDGIDADGDIFYVRHAENVSNSENADYAENAENAGNLNDTIKSCEPKKQETQNGKNICSKAESDILQMVLNYRQCPVGYIIVAKEKPDGHKAYICNRTVCNDISVDFDADRENCGGCGYKCGRNKICSSGECKCDEGYTLCNDACLDLNSLNASSCDGDMMTCKSGYADADKDINNGCEVNTNTDNNNCGKEHVQCIGGQSCNEGNCECPEDMVFCNSKCIDPNKSYYNCGAKGACSSDNESDADYKGKTCENGYCDDGTCQMTTCTEPAKLPCGNGGECIDVVSNATHCGTCGFACGTETPYCSNRTCVQCTENGHCAKGETCKNGECIECTRRTECGNAENGTAICDNYKCTAICNSGYHLSDDGKSCISDNSECGAGKIDCTAIAHQKSVSCTAGACVVTACKDGYIVNSANTACTNCTEREWQCGYDKSCDRGICKCLGHKKEICSPGQSCVGWGYCED